MKCLTPTDKKKTEIKILLDAVLNIRLGVTEPVPYERVLRNVAKWYGVDRLCLIGIRRTFGLVKERRICMYLMHQLSNLEYEEIAAIMGKKNSISVVHGINKIVAAMKKEEKLRNEVLGIVEKIKYRNC